ncbi:hypothetical protein BREVNS_1575 [Brevinematales bacterium NS]|nr:DUF4139 domain-containing protein [Brevinematales bacterium]QJR22325.1 hypothetical protein BREVNS_1575 [Brevinematales bacterium NS]
MRRNVMVVSLLWATFAWTQEAFIYQDRVVIEKNLDQATSVMIPVGAMNVEFQPVISITFEKVTNLYPEEVMGYAKEYMSLTNEVAQKRKKLQQQEQKLSSQIERTKLYQDLLRGLANNQGAKTSELMEKYERQLSLAEETLRQMREDIESLRQDIGSTEAKIQEINRFLAQRVIPMRVVEFSRPYRGLLRYSLSGGWKIRYTLSAERETLRADVEIVSSQAFLEQVSSLWIIGFPYGSQQMEERLPRLRLYLQRYAPRSRLTKAAAPAMAREEMLSEVDEMALSTPPVETTEGQGTVWHLTNRYVLSKETRVSLWEPRKVGIVNSYFALAPKSSWGWYAITLSNTLPYTLIPGEVIIESQGKTQRNILSRSVVPHTSYQFPGMEVRDIEVRRELVRDYRENPTILRSTILYEKVWKITVKNRLNKTISLALWERIPLPAEDKIVLKNVTATDKTQAELRTIQTNDGLLKWDLLLRPGEEKILSLGYTIEYPKDTEYYEQEE